MIFTVHEAVHSWLAANAVTLRDHVMFSTALLLVLIAVSTIPSLRPRTRHALVLLGVAKFLLPAAALATLAARLTAHSVTLPTFSMDFTLLAGASPRSEIFCAIAAAWLAGAILMSVRAIATQQAWRRAVLDATPASARETATMFDVALHSMLRAAPRVARSSARIPMTAGFLRPVVLLPDACADRLDDDELRAVLAHELAHVERKHNLTAILENVVMALFWFNPVLWLANVRLHAEAEKDCDERVLNFVPDPPTYLSGMLKASYGFIAPRPAGVSCMSTSQLKERMDHLMRHHESETRSIPHRLAIVIGVAAVVMTTVFVSGAEPAASAASPSTEASEKKGDLTPPKLVTRVDPDYPESARANRVEGMIVVDALIDDKGNVTGVSVAKGVEGDDGKALAEAAMAAVKQWKFEPAKMDGKPVATKFAVTINFRLDHGEKK